MDLYEHQGKDVFRAQGIPTPRGIVAATPEEAADATRELGGRSVVKVQVQIGGRGKGGGVVLVDSPERAAEEAGRMLRDGFKDMTVNRVLVEELLPIAKEFYTSFVLDRSTGDHLAMMTAEGGMDIEELARTRPEAIRRAHVDPMLGLRMYHVRELTGTLPLEAREGAADILREALRDPRRTGRHARRGEPARAAGGRHGRGARRQGHDRRQRAVAPSGPRGAEAPRSRSTRWRRARRTPACNT